MLFIVNSMKNEENSFYLPFKLLEPYFEKHCASKNDFKIAVILQRSCLVSYCSGKYILFPDMAADVLYGILELKSHEQNMF